MITDDNLINSYISNKQNTIIAKLSANGSLIIVVPDTTQTRKQLSAVCSKVDDKTCINNVDSINRYQGQSVGGKPHGKGTLTYCDGRIYSGEFYNGMRHGYGKLIMPNGEYFEGYFQNDAITEHGNYFDERGNKRIIEKSHDASLKEKRKEKFKCLYRALIYFALAVLCVGAIIMFFSSGGGVVRVGIFIAPVFLVWRGIKELIQFFKS